MGILWIIVIGFVAGIVADGPRSGCRTTEHGRRQPARCDHHPATRYTPKHENGPRGLPPTLCVIRAGVG